MGNHHFMKRLILLLCLLPALASAQRFEIALQGGVSGNIVPPSLLTRRAAATEQPLFHTGGLNPVLQVAGFCFVQHRLKLGPVLRYFSTSAEISEDIATNKYRAGKLSNVIIQFLSECDYRFIDGRKFTFDAGVVAGPALHIISGAHSINRWSTDASGSYHQTGFTIGLNFTGRYLVAKRISVNVSANPIYNMLSAPEDQYTQYGSHKNYSTLCLPVTAGIGLVL